MGWLNDEMIDKAGRFLWTAGRVLEQRRFAFHFMDAEPTDLVIAVDAYRGSDGGFAFGLEPDVTGPYGQPIATPMAMRVLREASALTRRRAAEICDWLESVAAPDGGLPAVLPTLEGYPRPPWLRIPEKLAGDLLTTGQVAGPLLASGVQHRWLGQAEAFCRQAIAVLDQTHPYEARAAAEYLQGAGDHEEAQRIGELVRERRLVLLDPDRPEDAVLPPGYIPGEYMFPHDYAPFPDSIARAWFTDAEIERSLAHLKASQEEDGGWPINWAEWNPHTKEQARPVVTMTALLTLKAYDRA